MLAPRTFLCLIGSLSRKFYNSFVRGGRYSYSNGSLDYRGSYGYYWESRVSNANYAHNLYFGSAYLDPQGHDFHKGFGFSLRCLAR